MSYRKDQCKRVETLIARHSVFGEDVGNGCYRGKNYPFILQDSDNNIYTPIRDAVLRYFEENNISWWGGYKPTTHPLSSQIACLNHLFPIRDDREAVLSIAQKAMPQITDVLPIQTDSSDTAAYVQFEAVSDSDHLNEKTSTRGSNCTSVDALILGLHEDGRKILMPIEWKYTEVYGNEDKAAGDKGRIRKERYTALIDNSCQLVARSHAIYYFEPFYQLMRQTLWAEQMISHKDMETTKADDFVHIHVIPSENDDLLLKRYPGEGRDMKDTWLSCLTNKSKYQIFTPKELLSSINRQDHGSLLDYLSKRYWNPLD